MQIFISTEGKNILFLKYCSFNFKRPAIQKKDMSDLLQKLLNLHLINNE